MVREITVDKVNKGGQANVFMVAKSKSITTLKDVGEQCVQHYLAEQKAAYCFVWGSEADYQARDPRHDGSRSCWIYFLGVPLAGGDLQVDGPDPVDYKVEKCPGGILHIS